MADQAREYPRPDFERPELHWESLDGPWDFIFDDDDVGLVAKWQTSGLPDHVAVATTNSPRKDAASKSDAITQHIAAGTQELLPDNVFAVSDAEAINRRRQIQVPYVFQCPASGINERGVHQVLWYQRSISDPRKGQDQRVLLRFGAVDYEARVWVNGCRVGYHRGGHVPFDLDITDALDQPGVAEHRLVVRVFDSAYDLTQPRGKQYWGAKPESIFYTPSGGIWQSVWLEVVASTRIADSTNGTVLRSNDVESGVLHARVVVLGRRVNQFCSIEMEASLHGVTVSTSELTPLPKEKDAVEIQLVVRLSDDLQKTLPGGIGKEAGCWLNGVALWSPEHPILYDITIRLVDNGSDKVLDVVKTSTGMRSIQWTRGDGLWRLNDKPYFQALCLDQGYWPESFMTASSTQLKKDIELAKAMGFNGCRKHQKVENPLFYYWADRLGYLVWAEMASAYEFSPDYVDRFDQEWLESVKLAMNFPSVVTWTPVNESWAYTSLQSSVEQRDHIRSLYYLTRALDNTRSINDNCGWEHVQTDLTTFHDYSDGAELAKTCANMDAILDQKAGRPMFVPLIDGSDRGAQHNPGAPIMCTEFGGVNIAPSSESAGTERDWGYTTARDSEDLLARVERLIRAVTEGGHCCAFVYTQLTDIEQEANGLYTYDRREKLPSAMVKQIIDAAVRAFYERVESA